MSGGFDGSGITKAISGANARVVGSPVEQQLLNKKNIVVLDNNFKIVNLKQPLTLAASPMMGEKFINSDDVFLNKLRYVLYGEQSDIVRANLWNNFQTAFPGVEDEPGYSWGFAVELNENRGVGSVVGGVRYKDSIILNIYVLNKYSDDSNLSAEKGKQY